jgi:hypothetical protein
MGQGFAIIVCLVLGLSACGGEADGEDGTAMEEVASTSQALVGTDCNLEATSCFQYSQRSLVVRVAQCLYSGSSHSPAATCPVPKGFVLIGGGAEVEGKPEPGALLTASYPDMIAQQWVAESKDHVQSNPHRLRAFSIGLLVRGMSVDDLRPKVRITSRNSPTPAGHTATAFATPPSDELLIGGGAESLWGGAGQLLTGSYPSNVGVFGASWIAKAKDHEASDLARITSYAISIPPCLTPDVCVGLGADMWNSATGGGYLQSSRISPSLTVTTSVGIQNFIDSGPGRLVTDMKPIMSQQGGVDTWTKDHITASVGHQLAYAIWIKQL